MLTALIGFVPTYQSIGLAAAFILFALRLIQGLCLDGEYGGAITYVAEHIEDEHRGYYTGWLQTSPTLGIVVSLATIIGIRTYLGNEAFNDWGWRLPSSGPAPGGSLLVTDARSASTAIPSVLLDRVGRAPEAVAVQVDDFDLPERPLLVRAAFRAAAERPAAPLVRAALLAAAERSRGPRLAAAECACRDSASCDAARWPSRLRAVRTARARRADGARRAGAPCPRA